MSTAREEILARIRRAVEGARTDHPENPGPPAQAEQGPPAVQLLGERLSDYGVTVNRCAMADLPDMIAQRLAARQRTRVVVPPGLADAWRPKGAIVDNGLSADELDKAQAAITACTVAAAANGSIMLNAGPDQGRRALALLVDCHICIVREEQIVTSVREAMQRLLPEPGRHAPITIFAGPSATSDIELNRVAGVHGPRILEVIIVGG